LSKKPADGSEWGFTLIEVTVALAVAGLGLVLIIGAAGTGLGNANVADRYIVAARRAQSHLAMVGIIAPLRAGEQSGDDGGGYSWRVKISEPVLHAPGSDAADKGLGLYTVDVTISWRDGFSTRNVSLQSKRLGVLAASNG
jgi:general secretion pathway protein I